MIDFFPSSSLFLTLTFFLSSPCFQQEEKEHFHSVKFFNWLNTLNPIWLQSNEIVVGELKCKWNLARGWKKREWSFTTFETFHFLFLYLNSIEYSLVQNMEKGTFSLIMLPVIYHFQKRIKLVRIRMVRIRMVRVSIIYFYLDLTETFFEKNQLLGRGFELRKFWFIDGQTYKKKNEDIKTPLIVNLSLHTYS